MALFLLLFSAAAAQQSPQASSADLSQAHPSLHLGSVDVSGSILGRAEAWDWFEANQSDRYVFGQSTLRVAFQQSRPRFAWRVELAAPGVFALPADALAANGAPLGIGQFYYAANHDRANAGSVFLSQGYVAFQGFGENGSSFRLGRFVFNDGAELRPGNETLAWTQQNRIAQRLLGDDSWSGIGRSFDGAHFSYDWNKDSNVSLMAGRPTDGIYAVGGMSDLNIAVAYAAYSHEFAAGATESAFRSFAIGFDDYRGLPKVDNSPAGERLANTSAIILATVGGDYLFTFPTLLGTWDMDIWGALQAGDWGRRQQRSKSGDAEIGWQLPWRRLRPWLRACATEAGGDHNGNGNVHSTFFPMLPSQRVYASVPFYALADVQDFTGQAILRPTSRFTVTAEVHKVKLDVHGDLWYQGSGAFQPGTFGYIGLPSVGSNVMGRPANGLANYLGSQFDYQFTRRLRISAYIAGVSGKTAMTQLLHGRKGGMGYSEFEYSF